MKILKLLDRIYTYLICIYIILLPFTNEQKKIKGMSVPGDMILASLILFYLVLIIISKQERYDFLKSLKDFFKDKTCIAMFLLLILMAVSVTYSQDKKLAVSETARFLSYICLFFIIKYKITESKEYHFLINSYIFTTILLCIFGIYQFFTYAGLNKKFASYTSYSIKVKIASTLTNPNNYAAYLLLCVFPVFMLLIYEKRKLKKSLYLLTFLIITVNIVLTFSRNVYLGFALGMLVLIVIYSKKLLAAFIPLIAAALAVPQIRRRLSEISSSSLDISRIKLWKTALLMFKDHPLLGVGNGNYLANYNEYIKKYPSLYYEYSDHPTHNSYLKVLSELGIFGIVIFAAMLLFIVINLYKFIKDCEDKYFRYFYTGFFASSIGFLFMNLFDNFFFVPKTTTYFWIMVSIFMGLRYKSSASEHKLQNE